MENNLIKVQKRSKRKRGAPLGNLNALKHGRYTREALSRKPEPVARDRFEKIDDHIRYIRDFMHHVFQVGMQSSDLDQTLRLLNTYALASFALVRLLRLREKNGSVGLSQKGMEAVLFPISDWENGSD